MFLIFCSDPLNKNAVDMDYEAEYSCARSLGISVKLINLEELLEGKIDKALSKVSTTESQELAIYRGWMIKPQFYENLFKGLLKRNVVLINNPEEYRNCHYFPNSYEKINTVTPYSNWIQIEDLKNDFDQIYKNLSEFGNKPIIIKDYVKSRKHEWHDAFFIPDASDRNHATQVINNFIRRQGEDIFYFNNKFLFQFDYWEDSVYDDEKPDLKIFNHLAQTISSNFFAMDIGKTVTGEWIVIELGDGQVSGLPLESDIEGFYKAIRDF